jgi:hypothetical protein
MKTIHLHFKLQAELRMFQERIYSRFSKIHRVILTSDYVEYKVGL